MKLYTSHIHELDAAETRGAVFSPCRRYRYLLYRTCKATGGGTICFVGLNPSTADAWNDDPTIRRCIGFASRWGYGRLFVLNLFAYRATIPGDMMRESHPTGPCNRRYLRKYTRRVDMVVGCWGAAVDGMCPQLVGRSCGEIRGPTFCLGTTRSGQPSHPLYLPKNRSLISFNGMAETAAEAKT